MLEKDEAENQLELCRKKHYVARQRLLEALLENDTISYTLAMDKLHLTASVIKAMENTGMIRVQATEVYRNPIRTTECEQTKALLSPAQRSGGWDSERLERKRFSPGGDSRGNRERKNPGIYGTDGRSAQPGKAGDPVDPGDCADLSDSAAFLSAVRRQNLCFTFPAFSR